MPTVFNFAQTKQINKKENKNREQADGSTAKIKRIFFFVFRQADSKSAYTMGKLETFCVCFFLFT